MKEFDLKRHRADSNRCTSFCRAAPSHSATMPNNAAKVLLFPAPKKGILPAFLLKAYRDTIHISPDGRVYFGDGNPY